MQTRPPIARPYHQLPFRPEVANRDRREDERDAEPAEESENRFNIRHLSSLPAPPFGVDRLGRQEQAERDEAQVVDDVLGVDDALGEVVEVLGDRQEADDRRARSGPTESANQLMTQSIRNTAKVTTPATIWFFVRLEMNRPSEMKQPPSSSSPR